MECAKVTAGVRKVKKKQVKDELDRIKQAEKKKRRLEKALATSAAIRSELEKKKQKKIEEQQRLDEEGAAIAEAVALRVLLGESDSDDDSLKMKDEGLDFNPWDCASNFDFFMGGKNGVLPRRDLSDHSYSLERAGWASDANGSRCEWIDWGNNGWTAQISSGPFARDLNTPCFEDGGWEEREISAGLIAAQAVSSLQIAEDAHVDAYVFNRMLRG